MADSLFNQMLQRAVQDANDQQGLDEAKARMFPVDSSASPAPKTVSPLKALLAGSLADSASTYAFLKQGTSREGNAALQYMNGHPNRVLPSAAAGAVGYALLYKLLHKFNPSVADTLAGGLGAYHAELAGHNITTKSDGQAAYKSVRDDQMQRALTESLRNK